MWKSNTAAFLAGFFRVLTVTVTIVVLAFTGFFTIPRLFGVEPYIVRSSSMEPGIPVGAAAFVDTRQEPENAGQVIAYRMETGESGETITILHRITAAAGDGWITKGDANGEEDENIVAPEAVAGVYLFSVPRAGFILAGMQGGRILAAAGIVVLLNVLSLLADEGLAGSRTRHRA